VIERKLGKTGLKVSSLCFGCWQIGGGYWGPIGAKKALNLLQLAFDHGVTTYEMSNVYGNGRAEVIVGEAFHKKRDKIILISKAGYLTGIDGTQSIISEFLQSFNKKDIIFSCEQSLRRLRTEWIDIFLLHDPPMEVLTNKKVWDVLRELKRSGKIRFYGAAVGATKSITAIQIGNAEVIEVPFNFLKPKAAIKTFPLAIERGVGVLARSPFCSGRLFKENDKLPSIVLKNIGSSLVKAAIQYQLSYKAVSSAVIGIIKPKELKMDVAVCGPPYFSKKIAGLLTDELIKKFGA